MKYFAAVAIFLSATAIPSTSHGAVVWRYELDGGGNLFGDGAGSVALDSSDNIIAAGTLNNTLAVVKLAPNGTLLWRWLTADARTARVVAVDAEDEVFVAGSTSNDIFFQFLVVKLSADGTELWRYQFSEQQTGIPRQPTMALDTDGSIVVGGFRVLLKLSDGGQLQWERLVDLTSVEELAIDSQHNVITAGFEAPYGAGIRKWSAAGDLLWSRSEPGTFNAQTQTFDVAVGPDDSIMVGGQEENRFRVERISSDGFVLWTKLLFIGGSDNFGLNASGAAFAVAVNIDGSIAATGRAILSVGRRFIVAKLSADGELQWTHDLEPAPTGRSGPPDAGGAVTFDRASNVVASGLTTFAVPSSFPPFPESRTAFTVVALSPDGRVLFSHRLKGTDATANGGAGAHALVTDSAGDVVVVGTVANRESNADFVVAKFTTQSDRVMIYGAHASSALALVLDSSYAGDGNPSTRWSSEFSDSQFIQVDLGQDTAFDRIVLRWESARAAEEYEIQGSSDGETWSALRRVTASGDVDDLFDLGASARYVRMQGFRRATQWGYSLFEFEVYRDGINIAAGRPMKATSTERIVFPATFAADGDPTTRWSSDFADEQWLAVDLGSTVALDRVVLKWEAAYGADYDLVVSNDGLSWTTVRTVTHADGGVDELTDLTAEGRYVGLLLHRRGTPWGFSLWEFEAYGSPAAIAP